MVWVTFDEVGSNTAAYTYTLKEVSQCQLICKTDVECLAFVWHVTTTMCYFLKEDMLRNVADDQGSSLYLMVCP
ncbi:hypothetical protein CSKR_106252, partial [Clonorchis sinensis]